jgi:hypothetical protein
MDWKPRPPKRVPKNNSLRLTKNLFKKILFKSRRNHRLANGLISERIRFRLTEKVWPFSLASEFLRKTSSESRSQPLLLMHGNRKSSTSTAVFSIWTPRPTFAENSIELCLQPVSSPSIVSILTVANFRLQGLVLLIQCDVQMFSWQVIFKMNLNSKARNRIKMQHKYWQTHFWPLAVPMTCICVRRTTISLKYHLTNWVLTMKSKTLTGASKLCLSGTALPTK